MFSQEFQTPVLPVNGASGAGAFYLQATYSRDARGTLQSVVFGVYGYLWTPEQTVVTGVEIRRGEAGPVILRVPTAPRTVIRDKGLVEGGGTFATGNPAAIAAFEEMASGSRGYYFHIVTEAQPAGAFTGPIGKAEIKYLSALGGGYHVLYATVSRDSEGVIDSALLQIQASYLNPEVAGRWRLRVADVDLGSPSGPPGAPPSAPFTGVDVRDPAARAFMERLLADPGAYSIEALTAGGESTRGVLRPMERILFDVRAVSPAGDLTAPIVFELDFTRTEDGTAGAGMVFLLADFGTAAVSATVRTIRLTGIPAGDLLYSLLEPGRETGFQIGRWMLAANAVTPWDQAGREALERLVSYAHTVRVAAGGAGDSGLVSAPVASPMGAPSIRSVHNATGVAGGLLAPGSLINIDGDRLARFSSALDGWTSANLPLGLNGVVVEVGGIRAPLRFVSPSRITALVPAELGVGQHLVAVHNGEAPSEPAPVRVASAAPALFDGLRPMLDRDILEVFATGLPRMAPATSLTAKAGDGAVAVLDALPVAGLAGVYRIRLHIPALEPGNHSLTIAADGAVSNAIRFIVP
jgi:uncharacterized protein (TIGR03437 family)